MNPQCPSDFFDNIIIRLPFPINHIYKNDSDGIILKRYRFIFYYILCGLHGIVDDKKPFQAIYLCYMCRKGLIGKNKKYSALYIKIFDPALILTTPSPCNDGWDHPL